MRKPYDGLCPYCSHPIRQLSRYEPSMSWDKRWCDKCHREFALRAAWVEIEYEEGKV